VAHEFKQAAVERIRAALSDQVDGGAGASAELGRIARGLELDFGDSVDVRVHQGVAVGAIIVVLRAVNQEVTRLGANAVHPLLIERELRIENVQSSGDHTGRQAQQLRVLTAVQGDLAHLQVVDDAADVAGGCLYRLRGRGDLDRVGGLADFLGNGNFASRGRIGD